jgi:starch synthase (maltosyl-transferring)
MSSLCHAAAVGHNSLETQMAKPEQDGRRRAVIETVSPEIDGGRFAVKRTLGDTVRVEADIFTDGHDSLGAAIRYWQAGAGVSQWQESPLAFFDNDRWAGTFPVTELGRARFTIFAWVDHWETWLRDLVKRIQAGNDSDIDYLIGANLIEEAAQRAGEPDRGSLLTTVKTLRAEAVREARRAVASDDALNEIMRRYHDRRFASQYERELEIVVDPVRARFSAWYEMFPRSTSTGSARHGTFADCEARLAYVAELGFDILYLPPIHPIGVTFRKGKNNVVQAEPGDVGSPWAIGAQEGGHKSINPELGTLEDFRRLVKKAGSLGIQIALDIAFQVSPDHPYVKESEEWFKKRPDGTIQYAENPPKKYQDIYPFEFETPQWFALWQELKSVFVFWIEQGVTIFRVDNPHTKAFLFWEWCISEIKRECPEALFLAEAFTRPKVMYRLAKLGFSQSYTYFPWRTGKSELTTYLTELSTDPVREFLRPNQWPNTPDILTEFLQSGSRAAFVIRYLLAATLGANYGIYGPAFELLESKPLRPGSEEYLNSEKYQIRQWDLERPDSLRRIIGLVNRIRRENAALQTDWGLEFHPVSNDSLLCYSKRSAAGDNVLLMVVNLDPNRTQAGIVDLPIDQFGIAEGTRYQANDLLNGEQYVWTGRQNYVELNPAKTAGHILEIGRG